MTHVTSDEAGLPWRVEVAGELPLDPQRVRDPPSQHQEIGVRRAREVGLRLADCQDPRELVDE
eukprot:11258540-Heterocapsa_arctica.AAC.1